MTRDHVGIILVLLGTAGCDNSNNIQIAAPGVPKVEEDPTTGSTEPVTPEPTGPSTPTEETDTTPPAPRYVEVRAGGTHSCALDEAGEVTCWGEGGAPPAGLVVGTLSDGVGFNFACAIESDGHIACWGDSPAVQDVPAGDDYTKVSCGQQHCCALSTTGGVTCWGADNGDGETVAPSGSGYLDACAGYMYSCVVTASNTLDCWGDSLYGDAAPPNLVPDVAQVSCGASGVCWVDTSSRLACHSWDSYLLDVPSGYWATVDVGGFHACAYSFSGGTQCWGPTDGGALDVGQVSGIPSGTPFHQVSAGDYHTCAVDGAGAIVCWGSDLYGQSSP